MFGFILIYSLVYELSFSLNLEREGVRSLLAIKVDTIDTEIKTEIKPKDLTDAEFNGKCTKK